MYLYISIYIYFVGCMILLDRRRSKMIPQKVRFSFLFFLFLLSRWLAFSFNCRAPAAWRRYVYMGGFLLLGWWGRTSLRLSVCVRKFVCAAWPNVTDRGRLRCMPHESAGHANTYICTNMKHFPRMTARPPD